MWSVWTKVMMKITMQVTWMIKCSDALRRIAHALRHALKTKLE